MIFLRSSRLSALCSRIFACTARCATPPTYLAASKKTYPSAVLVFIIANGLLITPSSSLSSSFTSHPLSPPSVLYFHFFPSSLPPLQRASFLWITPHNYRAFGSFSYPEALTHKETFVALFSASFNLYLPWGCCASFITAPLHSCSFTNHTSEKLRRNHCPILLSAEHGAVTQLCTLQLAC